MTTKLVSSVVVILKILEIGFHMKDDIFLIIKDISL